MRLALLAGVLALTAGVFTGTYKYRTMLGNPDSAAAPLVGGFSKSNPAANDEGVEAARQAVAEKLSSKLGRPVKVEVLDSEQQVVAGINYRLKLRADDSHITKKYYSAQVWAKLPAQGGGIEVTKLDEITADAAGVSADAAEGTDNPEVDAAAAYAVQQLSQQSNSLFPFQLKKVITATKSPGCNGENKEGCTHHLRLLVRQGSMPDQQFEVDVAEAPHGHVLKSSKQMV